MINACSSSPRVSNCSSETNTKEDKTNDICKGLAEELELLPENKP